MATIGTLVAQITGDTSGLRRAERDAKKHCGGIENSLKSMKRIALTAFAGWGVSMMAKRIGSLGMTFDRSMSIVKVTSRATATEFIALSDAARKMGQQTEFSAAQSADALKFLAMAGLSVNQQLKALPQMLNLATAGQLDLAYAADLSTNIMTQMGLKVEELTRVNDALAATASTANTNIREMGQAFVYAGAKARAFDVDIEELSAMIGMLANAGIKAMMAGTTIRQSMLDIIRAVADPGGVKGTILEEHNIKVIDESTGKLRSYVEILKELANANLSTIETSQLFGARAANITLILDQGSGALQRYIDRLKAMEGIAQEMADTIREDVQGAFDSLLSVIGEYGLRVWDEYRDSVKAVFVLITQTMRAHFGDIDRAAKQSKEFLWDFAESAWGAFDSMRGVFDTMLDGLKTLGSAIGLVVKLFNTLELAARGWMAAFAASEKGGSKIIEFWHKGLSEVAEGMADIIRNMEERGGALGKAFLPYADQLDALADKTKIYGGAWEAAADNVDQGAQDNIERIGELQDALLGLNKVLPSDKNIVANFRAQMEARIKSIKEFERAYDKANLSVREFLAYDLDKSIDQLIKPTKMAASSTWDFAKSIEENSISMHNATKASEDLLFSTEKITESWPLGASKMKKGIEALTEAQIKSLQSLEAFLKEHEKVGVQSRSIERLKIQYEKLRKVIANLPLTVEEAQILFDRLAVAYRNDLALMVDDTEEGTGQIYDLWQHTYEKMTDILADFFETGKFNLKDFVDFFKRQMAQIAAAWVMGNQTQGGFSFGNMFGGLFSGGGRGTQPGSSGLQQGIQGASSAYSLSQAYGAYTTAGGGWGGVKAGTGSFFGGGSGTGIGAVSWSTWAAIAIIAESMASKENVRRGYGRIEGGTGGYGEYQPGTSSRTSFMGLDLFNEAISTYLRGLVGWDEPTATGYQSKALHESDWGNFFKASFVAAFDPLGLVEGALGAIGIDLGKIFGFSNKQRSYYGKEFEFGDYSPEAGWGDPSGTQYRDKRSGKKAFGEAGESMASTALGLMNSLDSLFKGLLGTFGDTWVSKFTTEMIGQAAQKPSFDFYISAEDQGEFEDDWRRSWQEMSENLIDPIVTIGTDLLSQALNSTVTDATAWNYFSDEMQGYLKSGLEDSLAGLRVDWSTVTDQASFEAAIEQMGLASEQIAAIVGYFDRVGSVLEYITTTIDMHKFSDSIKGAVSELKGIESEFLSLKDTLESAGIDLVKYTDYQKAFNMAIQDWIEKAFVGAISYASTSQGWQAMAPQGASSTDVWIQQYQHIQDLYNAYDGTTASAIELSDALGILSGLSHDLAAEIQGAISSIHESYTSALESMYLETLSGQGKYDYYRAQVRELYAELPSLTSVATIRQYMDDILQYSTAAYGMMDEAQKRQYYAQYEAFLTDVETEGTARLEEIGKAMDDVNKNLITELTPLIINMVTDIQSAAQLQVGAADTQIVAANAQLDAASTPIVVDINLDSAEVG